MRKYVVVGGIILILLVCFCSNRLYSSHNLKKNDINSNNSTNNNNNNNNIIDSSKKEIPIVNIDAKNYRITLDDFDLNNYLKKYIDKKDVYDVMIDYIDKDVIYGSVLNTVKNQVLFTTSCLFQYNMKSKEYKEYKYDKGRIFNYYIDKNIIYYISEEVKENAYEWKFNKTDIYFKNEKVLESGIVTYDVDSPRLLRSNVSNDLYLFTVKNNKDIQTSNLYKIDGEKLEEVKTFFGNHETKKGNFISAMLYMTLNNGKLYYIVINDYEKNSLIEYDIKTKNSKVIKEDLIENYYQEFFVTDLGIYMNAKNQNSINNYFKKENNDEFQLLDNYNKEFYFARKLNNHMISLVDGSRWFILDTNDLKIYAGPKYEEQYHSYFILNDNKILLQKFNEKWYIGNVSNF